MTEGEKRFWSRLKLLRQSHNLHVRRQAPIGPYVADFAIHALKLIIEVDGEHHQSSARQALDRQRDQWFAEQGYQTLRFATGDLISNMDGCLQAVLNAAAPPPLTPPHKGEGNRPALSEPTFTDAADGAESFATISSPSPSWGGTKGGGLCKPATSQKSEGETP